MIERFLNVVGRSKLHRFDRRFNRAVACHHDEFDVRVLALYSAEKLNAVHLRHLQVREHEINIAVLCQQQQCVPPRCESARLVPLALEQPCAHRAVIGVIFDDENTSSLSQRQPRSLLLQGDIRGMWCLCL